MTTEELETIVCKHEMQRLELKESFRENCDIIFHEELR